jgi:predicted ATP-grasp superfamily ATP-dependent carboligase
MQGLDAHYSALWVENERKQAEKRTKTYTVSVAIEGYVDIVIDAASREEAEASALDKVEVQGMLVTELTITDVEQWK